MTKKKAVYKLNYYDAEGKRRGKSFTAPTMREAKQRAADWKDEQPEKSNGSMTVLEAVDAYIRMKDPVLSPVTTKQYRSIRDTHIEGDKIASMNIDDLSTPVLQAWINHLIEKGKKPKTVKNILGLLRPAVKIYNKTIQWDEIRTPQLIRYRGHTPGDSEVQAFIESIREKDRQLYLATLLGAFGPMRRSEICALTSDDIKGTKITVHRAKVPGSGGWVIKEVPKTDAANRTIVFPDFVAKELKGIEGEVITCSPTAITKRFKRRLRQAGLPECRFHDLRHYAASIMHANKVPDVYIIERAGWSSDYVMKRIYRDTIDEEKKKQTEAINSHFSELLMTKK